jgi:hypothetical protein
MLQRMQCNNSFVDNYTKARMIFSTKNGCIRIFSEWKPSMTSWALNVRIICGEGVAIWTQKDYCTIQEQVCNESFSSTNIVHIYSDQLCCWHPAAVHIVRLRYPSGTMYVDRMTLTVVRPFSNTSRLQTRSLHKTNSHSERFRSQSCQS